jgi:hypothetical protein
LQLDEEGRELVQRLGSAINRAIENSSEVANAIAGLRDAGYEMELMLKLEIGLRRQSESERTDAADAPVENFNSELTEEDRRTLRQMRIRLDDNE